MLLDVLQPRPDGQSRGVQPFLVDIHMELLLQDVGEGRDAVVQGCRADREHGIRQDRKRLALGPDFERALGWLEGLGGAKDGGADLPGVELARLDRQRVAVHQVPGVADRKSTRLNSSHGYISYAVFCLKKKTRTTY